MITTMQCSICSQLNNKHRVVVTDFRLHHTCSIIILWLHSLSGVIRSLLCNPRAFSPAIIIKWVVARNRNKINGWGEHDIRISVPFMRDTTRARARKYGKDAGLSPSTTHVRQ